MKIQDVRKRVEQIRSMSNDYEAAHAEEDVLYRDVLEAIAAGDRNARALAKEALQTKKIEFPRYCA